VKQAKDIYNTIFPNDGTTNAILGIAKEQLQQTAAEIDELPAVQQKQVAGQQQRTLNKVLNAFEQYCISKLNITVESLKFNTIVQKEKQLFAEFKTELRKQIMYCEYM